MRLVYVSLVAMTAALSLVWAHEAPVEEWLRSRITHLWQFNTLTVGGATVASTRVLADFYERRNFRPAWTDPRTTKALLRAIRDSEEDGLNPADYHLPALNRLWGAIHAIPASSPQTVADFDLLQTDALIRLAYHLLLGKVDPERLDSNWNMSRAMQYLDPVVLLQTMIDSGGLYQAIAALKPHHPFYTRLKAGLAAYRAIQSAGGWRPVPQGASLKLGMTDDRVPLLRQRLAVTGDLSRQSDLTSDVFDDVLDAAVRHFQQRHHLEHDGVVGPSTLAALNVPVAQYIDQLRVNLERGRWVLHDLPDRFIVVNIAGFAVFLVYEGKRVWEARAVVGSNYHQSPVFKATMKYVVFNPMWTVPRSITLEEMLPQVRRDPQYLQVRNINVIDGDGKVVAQSTLDWARYDGRFPYTLRQEPGANNALGQVKFVFPNRHAVFLHDTPSQSLFHQWQRDFSHGCIRVQHALQFAEIILDDPARWNADAIRQVVASGKTQTVFLQRPLPILLLYWTAEVDSDATVHFMPDIYGRDAAVLRGLQGPFKLSQSSLTIDW